MDALGDDTDKAGTPTAHSKKLFLWGVWASIGYGGALAIYAVSTLPEMLAMSPDRFATFLSGVFAPLAFLWLVLGFRQQGDELQNSARALWLQGEELRNSVEQQRQLVEVSREHLIADREQVARQDDVADQAAQPNLTIVSSGGMYSGPERTLGVKILSAGPSSSDVRLYSGGSEVGRLPILNAGGEIGTQRRYASPDEVEPLDITIEYTDRRGNRRAQRFNVPVDETAGPAGDRTLGDGTKLPGYMKL
jgi:hypothetical protein